MQNQISDFTENQLSYVSKLLTRRYSKPVELQLADSELQLDLESDELSLCPTIYWTERGVHFVVSIVEDVKFLCQFFYSETEQFGTGHDSYDDIEKCVSALLQAQSDRSEGRA